MSLRYVALLRGVNVGGRNKLPMADLRAIAAACGAGDVRSYIQSGNLLFSAEPAAAVGLGHAISSGIAERFGYRVPVVLRSEAALAQALASNPFLTREERVDESELHVLFLADTPPAEAVAALDPDRSPPDRFAVSGREVYLRLPQGMARTKLTNDYFDTKLGTVGTARNWRTAQMLLQVLRRQGFGDGA